VKNILVLTYWSYDNALITTYTLPYVQIIGEQLPPGSNIYLVTLTPKTNSDPLSVQKFKAELQAQNIHLLNYSYRPFGVFMLFKMGYIINDLLLKIAKNRIDVLHGWCTPGGAMGYLLSRVSGRPLVLDSFEPHAESMVETGTWKKNGLAHRLLLYLEKKQLLRSQQVIYTTSGMADYAAKNYGVVKKHFHVKPACVDLALFDPYNVKPPVIEGLPADAVVCVYAGKFGGIYLDREVFDFFKEAGDYWGTKFRVLLLTSHTEAEILELCRGSGFDPSKLIRKFVPHREVAAYMSRGTFGICPVKPVPTKRYCTPIKNGEYWALGLPVVITKNISTDSDLIEREGVGYVLRSHTPDEYRKACQKIEELIHRPGIKEKIRRLAIEHRSFTQAEAIYREIYA
jgi:glycosyltransferase involved in cell wall biosynthesis